MLKLQQKKQFKILNDMQLLKVLSDSHDSSKTIPFSEIHSVTKKKMNNFCKHTHRVF